MPILKPRITSPLHINLTWSLLYIVQFKMGRKALAFLFVRFLQRFLTWPLCTYHRACLISLSARQEVGPNKRRQQFLSRTWRMKARHPPPQPIYNLQIAQPCDKGNLLIAFLSSLTTDSGKHCWLKKQILLKDFNCTKTKKLRNLASLCLMINTR